MISSPVLSTQDDRDELLKGARSNVGLVADTIWAPIERDDSYRKLNRDLWKRICKIAANYDEITSTRPKKKRVRDVIPESRLSAYGDFEYEDDAEEYDDKSDKDEAEPIENGGAPTINSRAEDDNEDNDEELKEPWLLDEVEEYVVWVKKAWNSRKPIGCKSLSNSDKTLRESQEAINHASTNQENTTKSPDPEPDDFKPPAPPRFTVTNVSEAQLEGRVFSESVRNLWRSYPGPSSHQHQQHQQQEQLVRGLQRELGLLKPQPQKRSSTPSTCSSGSNSSSPVASDLQQTHFSFQNERLKIPSRCQYSYVQAINMVHRPLAPLCVDVPEFFPKGPVCSGAVASWPIEDHRTSKPIQYYSDNPYQEDLFTYKGHVQPNRKTVSVTVYQNTLMHMVATPMVPTMVWPTQAAWTQHRMMPMQIHHQMQPQPQPPPAMQPQPPPQQQPCPGVVHRPIRVQESSAVKPAPIQQPQPTQVQQIPSSHKGQIPVYQRQTKVTQDYSQQHRKNQGVDFNNLILLTKSAMKVRRNQTKGTKKFFTENTKLQTAAVAAAAAAVAKTEISGASSSRWFEKGPQLKREREYVTVPTTIPKISTASEQNSKDCTQETKDEEQKHQPRTESPLEAPSSRKRLYRDVLESSPQTTTPSPQPPVVPEESNFEKRYDELERQAMEQYRNSEECLAQRYQELEQQALEQYRTAESSESISADFENHSANSPCDDAANKVRENHDAGEEGAVESAEKDDQSSSSSGFGKCNPSKKVNAEDEKGKSSKEQQIIKILKPESKVHRAASEGSLRPIAVARRLGAGAGMGANSYLRESKNTSRGASEKIVKTSSLTSLKRRLMPMSPLDHQKSGGNGLMMRSNIVGLDPVKTAQTLQDKHSPAGSYYPRNAKVFHHHHRQHHHHHHHHHLHHLHHHHRQTGSGDDKANNIGVWISDFWS